MQILSIKGNNDVYTSNVYLLLGEWKRIEDLNTLIDVGSDPSIIETLDATATGIGKNKIDQVILTHGHSDHTAILPLIIEAYHPTVMAFSHYMDGVDRVLRNGDIIRCGDTLMEVIHTPCHTEDSICLYDPDTGALFVGDTPVIVSSTDSTYESRFYEAMKAICNRKVKTIYFGHGEPLRHHVRERLLDSLRNIRESLRN
jgi:glyoxylase-like metal-dependent hydrolase (beta-lactamase superfamily II)